MKWKEILITVVIVLVIIFLLQIILSFVFYKYSTEKMESFMKEDLSTILGLQVVEVSCVSNSSYELTLRNNSSETIPSDNLNFYIDKNKVVCEGISDLEPNDSSVCRISQFTTRGSHSLDISGPNFSMGQSVSCQ